VQDLYDSRAGDLVRDIYQLGAGSGVLDWKDDGMDVKSGA